jgi:hypothetical protein
VVRARVRVGSELAARSLLGVLGYSWGSDILFTYGPLGWVLNPMAFARDQMALALVLHVASAIFALIVADLLAREQLRLSR